MIEGYNERFEGTTLKNGDKCTGFITFEKGMPIFICLDKNGNEYETTEMPCFRIDLTNEQSECSNGGGNLFAVIAHQRRINR